MNLIELRRKATELRTKADAMLKLIDTEKRDATGEELEALNGLIEERKKLDVQIEMREKVEAEFRCKESQIEDKRNIASTVEVKKEPSKTLRFGELLQEVRKASTNKSISEKLHDHLAELRAISGMSETISSDGGFLVGSQTSTQLLESVTEESVFWNDCTTIEIGENFNGTKMPIVNETSRVRGSRLGGVQTYWGTEASSASGTKPKLGELALDLSKLTAICYVTEELMADTVALESFLTLAFTNEMKFELDDMIINGLGVGQPMGILNSGALVSVAKETGQSANTIVASNIVNMYSRMPVKSLMSANWYMSKSALTQLDFLAGSTGVANSQLMYSPPGALRDAPFGLLRGRPIKLLEQCQQLGTKGDIIFMDPKEYLLIHRGNIKADSSIHVKFIENEQTFRFVWRVNGTTIWTSPKTQAKGSLTDSPYVTLDTRA